jgi:hypothetical protein
VREIVAARLEGFVSNSPETIQKMLARKPEGVEFFDRAFAKRMAYVIGSHWVGIAEGATLFLMDEQGEAHVAPPDKPQ